MVRSVAIVIADAAPLIFLGKIEALNWLGSTGLEKILIPSPVRDEILKPAPTQFHDQALADFLQTCTICDTATAHAFSSRLSHADNCVLALALENKESWILSDDNLLRRMAALQDISVIGTLGVMLRALQFKVINAQTARERLEDLIQQHGFRIGAEVLSAVTHTISSYQEP